MRTPKVQTAGVLRPPAWTLGKISRNGTSVDVGSGA
jgi:hypothetical protein